MAAQLAAAATRALAHSAVCDGRDPQGGQRIDAGRGDQPATGLEVDVLSGEDEARLAFCGAAAMLDDAPAGLLGVLDVGGGSSEMVIGTVPAHVGWWASLQLGSSTLTDRLLSLRSADGGRAGRAPGQMAAALRRLVPPQPALTWPWAAAPRPGPAGRVDPGCRCLRAIAGAARVGAPSAVVAERYLIDPQRARLLPAGLLILQATGELLGAARWAGEASARACC